MRQILGRPTVVRGKTFIFCHDHQEIINKVAYDASNNVAVVFRGSVVWAIEVSKTIGN